MVEISAQLESHLDEMTGLGRESQTKWGFFSRENGMLGGQVTNNVHWACFFYHCLYPGISCSLSDQPLPGRVPQSTTNTSYHMTKRLFFRSCHVVQWGWSWGKIQALCKGVLDINLLELPQKFPDNGNVFSVKILNGTHFTVVLISLAVILESVLKTPLSLFLCILPSPFFF